MELVNKWFVCYRLWIYSIIVLNYIILRVHLVSEIFFEGKCKEKKIERKSKMNKKMKEKYIYKIVKYFICLFRFILHVFLSYKDYII